MKTKRSETDLTTWPTRELKRRALGLYDSSQTDGCPVHDLLEYQAVEAELGRRGYKFQVSTILSIVKE
jgi:hypothetical protein